MRNLCIAFLSIFIIGWTSIAVVADQTREFSLDEAGSVDEVVEAITGILERQGFTIALTVDHAGAADGVGIALAPTTVILALPPEALERRLLKRSDTVGIDLPLKFLVFQREGETEIQVNSNPVGYLIDRHDLRLNDQLFRMLQYKIRQFSEAENGLLTIQSLRTLDETVVGLKEAISANPAFRIPLIIDFGEKRNQKLTKNAHQAPVLIVFGNPNAGSPLMVEKQEIGIDLPQKFLVWEDGEDGVNITYNDPFFLKKRHDIREQDARLEAISTALRRFALMGAGRDPDEGN